MINRIRALFDRYAAHHLEFSAPGFSLSAPGAAPLGHVDRVSISGNRLHLIGWSLANQVRLTWNGGQAALRPHLNRKDVSASLGIGPDVGFEVAAPLGAGPYTLVVRTSDNDLILPVPPLHAAKLRVARATLWLRFLRDVVRLSPAFARWTLTGDTTSRTRIKSGLGLTDAPTTGPMEDRLFLPNGENPPPVEIEPITIVLPVFNAFGLLRETLDRVEAHTDLPWHLILIEDRSTDPLVRPWLKIWAEARPGHVTLLENSSNLGFIGSVNRGLKLAISRGFHTVLLNSDALVPTEWASRLIRPFQNHSQIASVTPMSNDAEIFSVPQICRRATLRPGEVDQIDAIARRFNPEATLSVVPTGVGFCMAMNIAYLRKLPRLDVAFGRGYGEEVDWCQKTRAMGGRHLGLPGLFVEHRGGASFGSEAKHRLVCQNNLIISGRYPGYDAEVQDFIRTDSLKTARVALAIAVLASRSFGAVPVYLAHSLGGGAEAYLQNRIRKDLARGQGCVVLRVGGSARWRVEVQTPEGCVSGDTEKSDFIRRLLEPLRVRRVIYSCGVGDPDPVTLPGFLSSLVRPDRRDRLEVLFHDFFPISPSYCLLDSDGIYRGPVTPDRHDPAHSTLRPTGPEVLLPAWQAAWAALLERADFVTTFSTSSRKILAAAYPFLADRIAVRPHNLLTSIPRLKRPTTARRIIGVPGNIGLQKGAAVLRNLANLLPADTSLVVIGDVDPAYPLPGTVIVHGAYQIEHFASLAQRYGVTDWLIPSIWPETFSFATHEALATGLPVFAFKLGAQGEAVGRADNGHLLGFTPGANLAKVVLAALCRKEEVAHG